MKPSITAVILTQNEEKMIVNCLACLGWCNERLVIDTGSDDRTVDLAERHGATVIKTTLSSFAEVRNLALKHLKTEWVVYIDADERVTPPLAKEILVQIETTSSNALAIARQNIMYGSAFAHGGWNEQVTRVFRVSGFSGWQGEIHESPHFSGEKTLLHSPLQHFTHRNTLENLRKTISWTPMEAKLFADSGIPPVTFLTIFRKGFMEFFRRAVFQRGYKDGQVGLIESLVQGINRMLVYIQVWELQQNPSLSERYEKRESAIAELWQKEK